MDQRLTDPNRLTREQGMEVARHAAGDAMEQAKSTVRNVGEQAWSAATNASATAQEVARRARDQVDPLYQQGLRAGEYVTRNVNDYPLAALLVAGVIGYLAAFLIHRNWQSE